MLIKTHPPRNAIHYDAEPADSHALPQLAVKPAPRKAEQALRQENDHHNENDAKGDQIRKLVPEKSRQHFAHELEKAGPDNRADQRANTTHHVENHPRPHETKKKKNPRRENVFL